VAQASQREIKTRSRLQKESQKTTSNRRDESNRERQNVAKISKGKTPEDLNTISRVNKKSRKIKKNNGNAVKLPVTTKLNRRHSTNDKKHVLNKRDQMDKKQVMEKNRKILNDTKEEKQKNRV